VISDVASEISEAEVIITAEQQDKIVQLCGFLDVAPHQIQQTVLDFDFFTVEELVDMLIDSPQLAELREIPE
jgi:hypothetical protein